MLLFSFAIQPLNIHLSYIKDHLGNKVAVSIPIEVWMRIKERYKDLIEAEEYQEDVNPE